MFENLQLYLAETPALAIVLAYLGGVLTSFTPCIFPVIPITIGVLGIESTRSKMRSFTTAVIYVLGMAMVYTIFGLIAALTGQMFGTISVHPITNLVVGNFLMIFALTMMGVIHIPLPRFLTQRKVVTSQKRNICAVFFMGALSGSVVAPCTAPVLATLLAYVGTNQTVFYGAVLLFAFGFGMGTLLILVGTFSSVLAALPKSGKWMNYITVILGFMMLLLAEYYFVRAGMFWY